MLVTKAIENGLVLPEVVSVLPTDCIHCGTPLELDRELTHLWCPNEVCTRLLANRLEKMCKVLGVKGLGQEMCMDIVESHSLSYMDEIFVVDPSTLTSRYGHMKNQELSDELLQATRNRDLATVIKSLGLPRIGSQCDKIFAGYSDLDSFYSDLEENPYNLISNKINQSIKEGGNVEHIADTLLINKELVYRFVSNFTIKQVAKDNIIVCITGSINNWKSKEGYVEYLNNKYDGRVHITFKSTIAKEIGFLLSERMSTSSKFKKAEGYGIPIYTSEQFENYLSEVFGN